MSSLPLDLGLLPWADPAAIPIVGAGKKRAYRTPDGIFPGPTTVLKVLGLSTEALVRWSANMEHDACLEAAADLIASGEHGDGPAEFVAAMEAKLGATRKHLQINERAKDIGSAVHAAVRLIALGQDPGPMDDPVAVAAMAFQDEWKSSGLKLIRSEQPIWDPELGIAGTADLIVECPRRGIGIRDLKSSKGVYDEYHLQVAAYCHMARRNADIRWAEIVRLPKSLDNLSVQVVPLGKMFDRTLSEAQLMDAFRHALGAWKLLVEAV